MNNEPVAWMLNGIIHECDPSDWAKEQYPDQDVIPLYTHPAKTLTEIDYAEFLPIWKSYIKDAGSVFHVQMVAHYFYNLGLKKAQ